MTFEDKTALVYDMGMWPELALRLSRDFEKVYYYNPTVVAAFPMSKNANVANGLAENVEQIDEFWSHVDEIDLFIFPDLYCADVQEQLIKMGKRVWGLRNLEMLETDREFLRDLQVELDMKIPETIIITGLDNLREHLQEVEDRYIKISYYRGDVESFHHTTYDVTKPFLDNLAVRLGPQADIQEFFVEEPIEPAVEGGVDTYVVDGKLPDLVGCGFEIKNQAFIGRFVTQAELPEPIKKVNDSLQSIFEKSGARGNFSTEVRVLENGDGILLDFCARFGSPPMECMMEAYSNLAEIMYYGAEGTLVEPKPAGEWYGCVMIHSQHAAKDKWISVHFPEDLRNYVKLKNVVKIGDTLWVAPAIQELAEIGAIVAVGSSMQDVVDKLMMYSKEVQGYELEIHTEALDKAIEVLQEAENYGIGI